MHLKLGLACAIGLFAGCQSPTPVGADTAPPVDTVVGALDVAEMADTMSDNDAETLSDALEVSDVLPDLSHPDAATSDVGDDSYTNNASVPCLPAGVGPKHIILFVGDGMGAEQYRAARLAIGGALSFDSFPQRGYVRTSNYLGEVTDSAAAATAMATGFKTRNSAIGVARPGDGSRLESVLELNQRLGRRVGLATVQTPMTDATPAGFGAHADYRDQDAKIAESMLKGTHPNILFGRASSGMNPIAAAAAGYVVATDEPSLRSVDAATPHIAGLFGADTEPPLAALTEVALDALAEGGQGFFLLLETEQADTGGHNNQLDEVVAAVRALSDAVSVAKAWAAGRDDTLIIVLSDHETGGLIVSEGPLDAAGLPPHQYTTGGHTGVDVPIFAWGAGAEVVAGTLENTQIFQILTPVHHASFQEQATNLAIAEVTPDLSQLNAVMNLDQDDPEGSGLEAQGLLRFDGLTTGPDALPAGAVIVSAYLVLTSTDDGDALALFSMRIPWDAATTWRSLGGDGVTPDNIEAAMIPDALSRHVDEAGFVVLEVTERVRAWLAGEENHGWAVISSFRNGVDIQPVGASDGPRLLVRYLLPR